MSNARDITVRGVVIGRRSTGEASARPLIYTDALGLVSVFAKSAREERSQLRPHFVEGTQGLFTLVRGSSFWRVTGATATVNAYFEGGGRTTAREAIARVLGLVRQFVRGEGSDPYLFTTLWGFLAAAPGITEEDLKDAEAVAVLRILAALGYVNMKSQLEPFLESPFSAPTFHEVRMVHRSIVGAINEGIAASGL